MRLVLRFWGICAVFLLSGCFFPVARHTQMLVTEGNALPAKPGIFMGHKDKNLEFIPVGPVDYLLFDDGKITKQHAALVRVRKLRNGYLFQHFDKEDWEYVYFIAQVRGGVLFMPDAFRASDEDFSRCGLEQGTVAPDKDGVWDLSSLPEDKAMCVLEAFAKNAEFKDSGTDFKGL